MLPKDPNMLLSVLNMKLRDKYSDLDDLCYDMDEDKEVLLKTMSDAGYEYDPAQKQFI